MIISSQIPHSLDFRYWSYKINIIWTAGPMTEKQEKKNCYKWKEIQECRAKKNNINKEGRI